MKDSQVRIGLIGLGTVGKGLSQAIADEVAGNTALGAVLVHQHNYKAAREFLSYLGLDLVLTTDPEEFFEADTTLIVEAAGQSALRQYGPRALTSQRDLLICATGVFVDDLFYDQLVGLARQNGKKIIIPSGAIAGIDALTSAALAGLHEVTIITRKPPQAWSGSAAEQMVDLSAVTGEAVCLFDGSAREAARLFPQNVNVAATLACAGIGLDRTSARLYADPTITRNLHRISVKGRCVDLSIEICGHPSPDNPRTSALTAYSIIKTVRNLTAPVVLG